MYRLFFFALISYAILLVEAQSCYWPNGDQLTTNDGFTACAAEGTSQCCADGHACLSNGLCFNPDRGAVYRGGCTDSEWSTGACPQFCNDMSSFQNSSATLAPCPPDANGQWRWWCGQDYSNVCGTPDENTSIFDYPVNASVLKVAGIDNETTAAIPTPAVSETAAAIPRDQTACPDRSDMVPMTTPIIVGIAAGVPLAMIAITMGFFFWKERKRRIIAERLGYAGQVISMAKQSYEKDVVPPMPVFDPTPGTTRQYSPGSGSKKDKVFNDLQKI